MRRAEREAAFVEYVAGRQVHLRRIAYAICGDWHRADDLLQTALTKLYVAWPRVCGKGTEDAYVRQIMVRANIDEHRRPWRRERVTDDLPETAGHPAHQLEERSELFAALQDLPEMQRKVIVLRHWLQLSVADTACELGIAEGTVKSHSSRGLAAMERALTPTVPGSASPR
jgi:RNA polymerase sigma-70 factor (sigma-E family)